MSLKRGSRSTLVAQWLQRCKFSYNQQYLLHVIPFSLSSREKCPKNNPKRRIKLWFMGNFKIKVYYSTLHAISLTCCDVIINLWIQFIDLSEV